MKCSETTAREDRFGQEGDGAAAEGGRRSRGERMDSGRGGIDDPSDGLRSGRGRGRRSPVDERHGHRERVVYLMKIFSLHFIVNC